MTPLTAEWVRKAEEDYGALEWLRRAPTSSFNVIGFHAQQCAGKYLKARLNEAGLPVPRTHDLERLLELLLPAESGWAHLRADCASLSPFAVESRYPGIAATQADADDAATAASSIRVVVRASLGISD